MPFFKTRSGINLHYEIYPRSSKKQLTFIHGHLGSSRWWTPVLNELKNKELCQNSDQLTESIVLIDFHGCGKSESPLGIPNFKFETVIADLNDLLVNLNLPQYNLIGHSAGGLIVLHLLAQSNHRYNTAVMISPVGLDGLKFDDNLYPIYHKMANNYELTRKVIGSTIFQNDENSVFFNDVIAADAFAGLQKLNHIFVDLLKNYSSHHIPIKIWQKTLIIHGFNDHLLSYIESENMCSKLKNSKVIILKNAGHCPIIETPNLVANEINHFYLHV